MGIPLIEPLIYGHLKDQLCTTLAIFWPCCDHIMHSSCYIGLHFIVLVVEEIYFTQHGQNI